MAGQDREQWYNLYKNILTYFDYRDEEVKKELSKEDLIKEMISSNFVHVKSKNIHVILTTPKQKYSSPNNEIKKKIIDILLGDNVKEILCVLDITLIGEKGLIHSQTIKKFVDEFRDLNENIWVQLRPYSLFINNIPKAMEVVKHRRLDQQEVKKQLELTYTPLVSLMRVHEWDPPVAWLGARVGEIIAVDRLSGAVGQQTILKRVIP